MTTGSTKNSQKKGQKPGNLADGGDPGGQPVTKKPDFLTFFELTMKMKKFSKSTSIICTERVFLYPADQNTKENGVKWGF
jgi:hypothetical protein